MLPKEGHILITAEVPLDRCFGDTESGVRPAPFVPLTSEVLKDKEMVAGLAESEREALKLGLIVFITEADLVMYYAPENVDLDKAEVKEFLGID
jgi:hypothetical protein